MEVFDEAGVEDVAFAEGGLPVGEPLLFGPADGGFEVGPAGRWADQPFLIGGRFVEELTVFVPADFEEGAVKQMRPGVSDGFPGVAVAGVPSGKRCVGAVAP